VPTPVVGKVCHGRPIAEVDINGMPVSTADQVFTPGDGVNTTRPTVPFDVDVPTDLAAELAGFTTASAPSTAAPTGSSPVRPMTSRTAFSTRLFAVAAPGELTTASVALAARGPDILGITREAVTDTLMDIMSTTEIPNAFVLGITGPALNTFFQATCNSATALVQQKINHKLAAYQFPSKSVNVPWPAIRPCTPTSSVNINGTSPATTPAGNGSPSSGVPPVAVNASAHGYCIDEIDLGILGPSSR
jgi:hypothetical protein